MVEVYNQNISGLSVVSSSVVLPKDEKDKDEKYSESKISVMGAVGDYHTTWCGESGYVFYQYQVRKSGEKGTMEQVSPYSKCNSGAGVDDNDLGIVIDNEGKVHIIWHTEEIKDTNITSRPGSYLVESIRESNKMEVQEWSSPSVISQPENFDSVNVTNINGDIYATWLDGDKYFYSVQKKYKCDETSMSNLALAGINAVIYNGDREGLYSFPYCQNKYDKFYYTPNPNQEISAEEASENGAFDRAGELINEAEYEVLFATMQYEANNSPPSPGTTLSKSVLDLYNKLEANPQDYPRGMTVKILLGNYPEVSDFTWGDQIYFLLEDLEEEGLPAMIDDKIGWRLEVANFAGAYPHSHSKFMVIDGKTTMAAGYNYGYLHLPKDHESGKGFDLFDLGIQVTGPVAQDSMSAFDDLWYGANRVHCDMGGDDWQDTCADSKAVVNHVPEVLRSYVPEGLGMEVSEEADSDVSGEQKNTQSPNIAFSLYRTSDSKEADIFISTSMAAAAESIDMVHVNFSLEAVCSVNVVLPGFCTTDNALLWMKSLMSTIEKNHTKVRVIMENSNMNGIENRVGSSVLLEELEERGLSEYVELRFDSGKIHAKSILMDDELLVVGSQNLHYSAWGKSGLTEYSLATTSPAAIEEYKAVFESRWESAVPFEDAEYGMTP